MKLARPTRHRNSSDELPLGHKNTFAFMRVALGDEFSTIIGYFDRMRVKRNQVIYDVAGLITENEAKAILAHATEFVETVKAELQEYLD